MEHNDKKRKNEGPLLDEPTKKKIKLSESPKSEIPPNTSIETTTSDDLEMVRTRSQKALQAKHDFLSMPTLQTITNNSCKIDISDDCKQSAIVDETKVSPDKAFSEDLKMADTDNQENIESSNDAVSVPDPIKSFKVELGQCVDEILSIKATPDKNLSDNLKIKGEDENKNENKDMVSVPEAEKSASCKLEILDDDQNDVGMTPTEEETPDEILDDAVQFAGDVVSSPLITTSSSCMAEPFDGDKKCPNVSPSPARKPSVLPNEATAATHKAQTKKLSKFVVDLLDSDSDSDSDFEFPASPFARQAQASHAAILEKFNSEADRLLQRLLWTIQFRFTLFPHQCMAVRAIAGVPVNFPLHQGTGVTRNAVQINLATMGLPDPNSRGVLVADEMGLGKTVEAVAGALLYNAIANEKDGKKKPSIIVTPNEAVKQQWIKTLQANGVAQHRIFSFKKGMKDGFDNDNFILMEKSKLQCEVKAIFDTLRSTYQTRSSSPLFPNVDLNSLDLFHNQYLAARGAEKNDFRMENEHPDDAMVRLMRNTFSRVKRSKKGLAFRSVIMDESHFLKNLKALWGIGGALMCMHGERSIPMTGTPYNNGQQDMVAQMAYIDPSCAEAKSRFWSDVTSSGAFGDVVAKASKWKEKYLIRRCKDEVLQDTLKAKHISKRMVPSHKGELFVYERHEERLKGMLRRLKDLYEDNDIRRANEQKTIVMACVALLRASTIHPLVPGGREFCKAFSPSRCRLSASENKPSVCVACNFSLRPTVSMGEKQKEEQGGNKVRGPREDLDLDNENLNDDEEEFLQRVDNRNKLVALPPSICRCSGGPVRHFVHKECLARIQASGDKCPRCVDAARRLHLENPESAAVSTFESEVYCKNITAVPGAAPGFKGSSKLNAIVKYVLSVPKDDKVLILSFFKGGLDLLEGIIVHDLKINCARFDGDLGPEAKSKELERFKAEATCKILLASVQSGGTGLNIVEANHVIFADRWFNPFVHHQAMDRCYRIGQKKDVHVQFFDSCGTIDEVMSLVNKHKADNAAIILADGTKLGRNAGGGMSYKELSGLFSRGIEAVMASRAQAKLGKSPTAFIDELQDAMIAAVLDPRVPIVIPSMDDATKAQEENTEEGDEQGAMEIMLKLLEMKKRIAMGQQSS